MMAITTKSSINVKPRFRFGRLLPLMEKSCPKFTRSDQATRLLVTLASLRLIIDRPIGKVQFFFVFYCQDFRAWAVLLTLCF
jgi:hypothetical protein